MNNRLTIVIPTFNEEKNLKRLHNVFKKNFNINVYDNFSTDDTRELALSFGWKVKQFKNKGFAEDPDLVKLYLKETSTDWIYICRADEVPSKKLVKLLDNIEKFNFDAIQVSRKSLLNGKRCNAWGDDYETPIFNKNFFIVKGNNSRIGYPGIFKSTTRIKRFSKSEGIYIKHFQEFSISGLIQTLNRYSSLMLDGYLTEKKIPKTPEENFIVHNIRKTRRFFYNNTFFIFISFFITPPMRFLWHFIYKKGFTTGVNGFLVSYLMSIEEALISAKSLAKKENWPD